MYIKIFCPFLKCKHVLCCLSFFLTQLVTSSGFSNRTCSSKLHNEINQWILSVIWVRFVIPHSASLGTYEVLLSLSLVEFTYFKSYDKNNLTFISFLARC